MVQPADRTLTPEERAQVLDIQERLIALLFARGDAVASGDRGRADSLQAEINDLLRQRDDIKEWASADAK